MMEEPQIHPHPIVEKDQNNKMAAPTTAPVSTPVFSAPLTNMSPERVNQQRIPQSPSLPSHSTNFLQDMSENIRPRRESDLADVKAKVAFFSQQTSLAPSSPPKSPTRISNFQPNLSLNSQAAFQRAVLGREEAETNVQMVTTQLEQAKARERLVSQRVEALMEQVQDEKNRRKHERQVYEREVKQCKKNEYKAELAVIKLQEEIREVKTEAESMKARAEHEKAEKEKARQEAFERAYVLAGLTEELELLKEKMKVVEQERDNAQNMAVEIMPVEVERQQIDVAVQTDPQVQEVIVRPSSKGKGKEREQEPMPIEAEEDVRMKTFNLDRMQLDSTASDLAKACTSLQDELIWVKSQLRREQDLVHFMNMQCQFKACSCRQAEREGVRFVHDYDYDRKLRAEFESGTKKRKAEDELPLPKYITLKQRREMRKVMKASKDIEMIPEQQSDQESIQRKALVQDQLSLQIIERAQLPSEVETMDESSLDLAAEVPLPTLGDDTAQLEEITQVMIEAGPSTSTKPFSFSTSTTMTRGVPTTDMPFRQSHNALIQSNELFDLSPPKQHPPRPSTALGVMSLKSPIRLVPDSPRDRDRRPLLSESVPRARTIQVPLKDSSPSRTNPNSNHSRSQSRSNNRGLDRGRTPDPAHGQPRSTFVKANSASPGPATLFPVTPRAKQANQHSRSHTVQHHSPSQTITTTVPLRGLLDSADVFTPIHPDQSFTDSHLHHLAQRQDDKALIPGTPVTREAALAQIRARRDRARSVNLRKPLSPDDPLTTTKEGGDIRKTPKSIARRGVLLERTTSGRDRDFSQVSAPGRF